MRVHLEHLGMHKQALCDCGWQGKRRWSRASAVLDAGGHAAGSGHRLTTEWEQLVNTLVTDGAAEHRRFEAEPALAAL